MFKKLWDGFLVALVFLAVVAAWAGCMTIVDAPKNPHIPLAKQFVFQFISCLATLIVLGVLFGAGWLVKRMFTALRGRKTIGDSEKGE